MQSEVKSQAFLRKRRFLVVLPLLVVPFLTLAFYALGGGRTSINNMQGEKAKGLNLQLPGVANKEEQLMDKLGFYDKAQKDSQKMAEWMHNDPYYKEVPVEADTTPNEIEKIHEIAASKYGQALKTSPYEGKKGAPEDAIMQKLSKLQKELDKPVVTKETTVPQQTISNNEFSSEVDRLGQMMQTMVSSGEPDPEMQQLQATLDKMLDVQHPERVRERLKEQSLKNKRNVFPVAKKTFLPSVSLLDTSRKEAQTKSAFYGLEIRNEKNELIAVEAVVHQLQTLVNGAVIKLRLLNEIFINGVSIPNGSFVFGTVSLNGERLRAKIESIRYNNNLLPVDLEVYDMDGMPGIYIPGAITKEVAQSSVDNASQMLQISSLDPSLKAQAAATGLDAVKSLISKKAKLVKLYVKDGYKVLLKDKSSNQ